MVSGGVKAWVEVMDVTRALRMELRRRRSWMIIEVFWRWYCGRRAPMLKLPSLWSQVSRAYEVLSR